MIKEVVNQYIFSQSPFNVWDTIMDDNNIIDTPL